MADEDETWLYGDSNPEPPGTEGTLPGLEAFEKPQDAAGAEYNGTEPAPPGEEVEEPVNDSDMPSAKEDEDDDEEGKKTQENGDAEGEGDGDEDEDSDEDNVNVVIGDISKAAPTYTNLNVHKRGGLVPASKGVGSKFSMEEFESVGVINGLSAVEFNVEILEDKPWRKPGADITDYFNYGFNEETWKAYCDRQKRMRINESGAGLPSSVTSSHHTAQPAHMPVQQNIQPLKRTYDQNSGQIHVVGGNIASRRLDQSDQQQMHLPPMGIPPPGFQPMQQPPFQQPPPFFPPATGPDYSDNYDQQWRPDSWQPNNLITPGSNNMPPPKGDDFQENFERDRYPNERERENERDDRYRDRDRDRERDDRDRDDRERDREDRDRERDREDRDRRDRYRRSRSRSHGRERSRARSRSRSPSHKKHKKKSKKSEKSDKKKRSDDSE